MLRRCSQYFVGMAIVCLGVSCATGRNPMGGLIYHDVKGPNDVVVGKAAGAKKGESCATNILGWIATGDASIAAAKKKGGITDVAVVDYSSLNILGVYGKTCAIVRGS